MRPPVSVAPPLAIAVRLEVAYGATVGQWRELALTVLVEQWRSNPVAFGPGARLDSDWKRDKMRTLERRMVGAPSDEIASAARRVDAKAGADFSRLLQTAVPSTRRDAKLLTGTAAKRNAKGELLNRNLIQLERVGLGAQVGSKVEGFKRRNVERIESIRGEQLNTFRDILDEAEAGGWRVEQLRDRLLDDLDVTQAKAEFLARDQTLKLAADITEERQTQAGISRYVWRTSNDERVRGNPSGKWPRGMHYELDGEEFEWADPPITNENGDRNHPGQDYQCRCIAIPVLPDFGESESE